MSNHQEWIRENVIRDMAEGVLTIGLDGVITSVNPAAAALLGREETEMVGRRYAAVFFDDAANDTFNQAVLDSIYDPDTRHEQLVPYHAGGETRQLYMVTSFLRREGQKVGVIVVLSDMTELTELKLRYTRDVEDLLDSLVKALSTAIDERSPYTAHHTQNMVRMAEAFLDWEQAEGGPLRCDESRRRAFLMSVGLHDIGKLTVPLEIMDKATRLGAAMERVEERFTKLELLERIAYLEGRITEADYTARVDAHREDLAQIRRINVAGYLPDPDLALIRRLAEKTWEDEKGQRVPLLTPEEVADLSIRKGTLTDEERRIMQGHAVSTWNILSRVHFPESYASVPVWAAQHHELMNAAGYPRRLGAQELSRETRLLTILDIFEALTARDRPYKPPIPLDKAWRILEDMAAEGTVDGALLEEFRRSGAWREVVGGDN